MQLSGEELKKACSTSKAGPLTNGMNRTDIMVIWSKKSLGASLYVCCFIRDFMISWSRWDRLLATT